MYPARSCEVLNANKVSLQLCKLLEVLQPDEAALELGSYLSHLLQRLCTHRNTHTHTHVSITIDAGRLGLQCI